jgi:hypothetical protein
VSIPKLPLTIPIFCERREETARRYVVSLQVDSDFDPRGRNNRVIGSERIYQTCAAELWIERHHDMPAPRALKPTFGMRLDGSARRTQYGQRTISVDDIPQAPIEIGLILRQS